MRYEKGHKNATHERILLVAARRFRQDGIKGSGVAGIMSEAGLTNGAFYAHFSSKEEMIEKSLECSIDEQWGRFESGIATGRLMDIVRAYLSKDHRDHPDIGCPSAALLPEISRQEAATRSAYTHSVERLLNAIERALSDSSKDLKARDIAIGSFGLVVGALQLARAVNDPSLSDDILEASTRVAAGLIEPVRRK